VLVERLAGDPQRALNHAGALTRIAPYDEDARATVIDLWLALGRKDQAQRHYEVGLRMLKEAGAASSGALERAWRSARSSVAVPAARASAPANTSLPSEAAAPRDTELVGRDAELARIGARLSALPETRRGGLLLVSGPPGIGKSRLLEAAAVRARARGAVL
jgi:hypothetical protein